MIFVITAILFIILNPSGYFISIQNIIHDKTIKIKSYLVLFRHFYAKRCPLNSGHQGDRKIRDIF